MLIRPGGRLISAGIAALAIGFALGLQAVPPGISVSETIQPKDFDGWASPRSQVSDRRGVRLASLESEVIFESATKERARQSELATSTRGRASSAEDLAIDWRAVSFDERFAGLVESPSSHQTTETEERAKHMRLPSPDLGGHEGGRRAVSKSARPLPTPTLASVSKKQLRIAEASASQDLSSPPDADDHTAIYDIAAQRVYLPNGQRLEAHSGMGNYLDDPRYVSEKGQGPTPPNVYDLSLREELFHGVRAIRLIPVGDGNMFGRAGMLAHSYMLGPTGQSNGCVSLSDYPTFLNAYLSGEINRLVVVEHLATTPSLKTASRWLAETIKTLFGRS